MEREGLLAYQVNTYLGVLAITIVGAFGTLLIVRAVYQDAFYVMVGHSSAANAFITDDYNDVTR